METDVAYPNRRKPSVEPFQGRHQRFEVAPPHRFPDVSKAPGGVAVYSYAHAASFAFPKWIEPTGHYVYYVWGPTETEEHDLLYVGVSSQILMRVAQHAASSVWWWDAEQIDVYQYDSREAAEEVEAFAIRQYGPIFNVVGGRRG